MSPPEPVVSLATVSVTGLAKRRHASVWAVVDGLENYLIPDAERSILREGNGGFSVDLLEEK